MPDAHTYDVVVVGAGIAGASLALALWGRGLRIAVVEARALEPPSLPTGCSVDDYDLRVSALTPRSRALLETLGAWEAIEHYRYCTYRHMTVWDAQGTGQIDFDQSEVEGAALGHIVENRVIVGALIACLRNSPDIAVLEGQSLAGCERLADGGVALSLSDGRELTARLLVAADGALSRVRELLAFDTREWDYGHRAIVATVAFEQSHRDTAWQSFAPEGPLALLPLPGAPDAHRVSIVWSQQDEAAQALLALDEADFCARLTDASVGRLGRALSCSRRADFPLRQRHAIDYVTEGVALVGDAAHTIHPLAGQGINLGLQDVAALAEEIGSAIDRGLDPGALVVLRRYQRRRKGDNLLMMAAMDGFKRLFEEPSLPVRWLRNTGMRTVDGLVPLKAQIMRHAMGLD
jgi:2-octaprenylphenol hydroxylase